MNNNWENRSPQGQETSWHLGSASVLNDGGSNNYIPRGNPHFRMRPRGGRGPRFPPPQLGPMLAAPTMFSNQLNEGPRSQTIMNRPPFIPPNIPPPPLRHQSNARPRFYHHNKFRDTPTINTATAPTNADVNDKYDDTNYHRQTFDRNDHDNSLYNTPRDDYNKYGERSSNYTSNNDNNNRMEVHPNRPFQNRDSRHEDNLKQQHPYNIQKEAPPSYLRDAKKVTGLQLLPAVESLKRLRPQASYTIVPGGDNKPFCVIVQIGDGLKYRGYASEEHSAASAAAETALIAVINSIDDPNPYIQDQPQPPWAKLTGFAMYRLVQEWKNIKRDISESHYAEYLVKVTEENVSKMKKIKTDHPTFESTSIETEVVHPKPRSIETRRVYPISSSSTEAITLKPDRPETPPPPPVLTLAMSESLKTEKDTTRPTSKLRLTIAQYPDIGKSHSQVNSKIVMPESSTKKASAVSHNERVIKECNKTITEAKMAQVPSQVISTQNLTVKSTTKVAVNPNVSLSVKSTIPADNSTTSGEKRSTLTATSTTLVAMPTTPAVKSTPTSTTPAVKSTPTPTTPAVKSAPPMKSTPTVTTPAVKSTSTSNTAVKSTPKSTTAAVKSTPTVTTPAVKSTHTPTTPAVKSAPPMKSTPTSTTPAVKYTPTSTTPATTKSYKNLGKSGRGISNFSPPVRPLTAEIRARSMGGTLQALLPAARAGARNAKMNKSGSVRPPVAKNTTEKSSKSEFKQSSLSKYKVKPSGVKPSVIKPLVVKSSTSKCAKSLPDKLSNDNTADASAVTDSSISVGMSAINTSATNKNTKGTNLSRAKKEVNTQIKNKQLNAKTSPPITTTTTTTSSLLKNPERLTSNSAETDSPSTINNLTSSSSASPSSIPSDKPLDLSSPLPVSTSVETEAEKITIKTTSVVSENDGSTTTESSSVDKDQSKST